MSDIKTSPAHGHVGRNRVRGSEGSVPALPSLRPSDVSLPESRDREKVQAEQAHPSVLLSEFTSPSTETRDLLGNPAMMAALVAISQEIAPDGVAASTRDRYVASVIETHVSAKRQLAKHLNALLRA